VISAMLVELPARTKGEKHLKNIKEYAPPRKKT
jgi:hypothetical protein